MLTLARGAAAGEPLRVMTWNIRYDNPGDGPNAWKHRKDWFAEIVRREKLDLAGFQEVLASQFEDLKERLPDFAAYGVGRNDGKASGEFVPIFFRKERFERLNQGTFWLSEKPGEPGSKGWDAAITRISSWVQLKDKVNNNTLYVLNAHFDHRGVEARQKCAELIKRRITEDFADHPVIFMGDLNVTPKAPPYQVLTAADGNGRTLLRDAYKSSENKPEGPDSTWNGFSKIEPGNRIDYVFLTESLRAQKVTTLVDQRDGRFPSDHLPVVVEIMRE